MMMTLPVLTAIALAFGWAPTVSAQAPQPAPTNMTMRIMQARKANAALMRQYSWTSRTELSVQVQNFDYNRNN